MPADRTLGTASFPPLRASEGGLSAVDRFLGAGACHHHRPFRAIDLSPIGLDLPVLTDERCSMAVGLVQRTTLLKAGPQAHVLVGGGRRSAAARRNGCPVLASRPYLGCGSRRSAPTGRGGGRPLEILCPNRARSRVFSRWSFILPRTEGWSGNLSTQPPPTSPSTSVPSDPIGRYLLHPGQETSTLVHHASTWWGVTTAVRARVGSGVTLKRRRGRTIWCRCSRSVNPSNGGCSAGVGSWRAEPSTGRNRRGKSSWRGAPRPGERPESYASGCCPAIPCRCPAPRPRGAARRSLLRCRPEGRPHPTGRVRPAPRAAAARNSRRAPAGR